MRTADFDYELPLERIAQTPVEPRDAARLMVVERGQMDAGHRRFRELDQLLSPGDLLVVNDSRVIPARLVGHKADSGGSVEALLLQRTAPREWQTLIRGRVRVGMRLQFAPRTEPGESLGAEVAEMLPDGVRVLRFDRPITPLLPRLGAVPLPPYITAPLDDPERYQTVYSRVAGSVAAPTAGLHFTPGLLQRLDRASVRIAFVTLHVGLDTFRPVASDDVADHEMHSEWAHVPSETAAAVTAARHAGRRVVAVGTTSVRALEAAAASSRATTSGGTASGPIASDSTTAGGTAAGSLEPGNAALSTAAERDRRWDADETLAPYDGWTDLFITPGYRFQVVNALVTNFHLPRTTLLMLVAAFAGTSTMQAAYAAAIDGPYRFYSFGDAMLIR